MNIDWGWVWHLLEARNVESLKAEATKLEKLAETAEEEVKIRKRIAEARKRIDATKPLGPFSNISKGIVLLLGLIVLLIVFLVLVKSCG